MQALFFPYFKDALLENGAAQRLCHASHSAVIYYPANAESDFCGFGITPTSDLENIDIKLFPNPTHDFITITLSDEQKLSDVLVYNVLGELVWKGSFEMETTINVSTFSTGIYHLIFSRGGETWKRERFVKY